MHLKQLFVHNNELEALENLPASLTQLDVSGNCLTNDTLRGLNMLVDLEAVNISGNDLGSSLPKCFSSMSKLSELQVSDNHLDTLQHNLPTSLVSLTASRNHLSGRLSVCSLPNLTELHIAANRITGLPPNLHLSLPLLDLLDISDNRIAKVYNISSSIGKLEEVREP